MHNPPPTALNKISPLLCKCPFLPLPSHPTVKRACCILRFTFGVNDLDWIHHVLDWANFASGLQSSSISIWLIRPLLVGRHLLLSVRRLWWPSTSSVIPSFGVDITTTTVTRATTLETQGNDKRRFWEEFMRHGFLPCKLPPSFLCIY